MVKPTIINNKPFNVDLALIKGHSEMGVACWVCRFATSAIIFASTAAAVGICSLAGYCRAEATVNMLESWGAQPSSNLISNRFRLLCPCYPSSPCSFWKSSDDTARTLHAFYGVSLAPGLPAYFDPPQVASLSLSCNPPQTAAWIIILNQGQEEMLKTSSNHFKPTTGYDVHRLGHLSDCTFA